VTVCARCGLESPDHFAFCPACGAGLASTETSREVRKVVSILFCDLTGSTAIGERTDPEALRALMTRYYDTARAVLERHGGTVEKFVGDAVMAVFGIPVATEDDALRATRAAVELRDTVHELGLEARIGINTGAVVAGEGDTLVTGDAVNVAARLEQSAAPGEILLGDDTLRLVRDAVEVQPVELTVKGKAAPVAAHRLIRLDPAAAGVARRFELPLVGRARERQRLRADFADVVAARTCRLFTLIGPAGIGKSRLVADFLAHVDESATVTRGRALSYGEGITYWPLVEMLVQLGIEPGQAIRPSPGETQLATRALLEERAASRPLVLVVDDLHWAEPPMLDLVEHVADWAREAPIFLLCVARPELLDRRPSWGGAKLNATSVLLEPLDEVDAGSLASSLLAGVPIDDETRHRILATAEGNPLFLEEMSALAREVGRAVEVPPTIQALLQARLDTLDPPERTVIERGAVEGKVFHRSAVTALAPEPLRDGVPGHLVTLVRKELVRPDRSVIPEDDAFRFRHLLIRDTAYEGLPKAVRAELHERFAAWLDGHVALLEQDEIAGYHLEQAAHYRSELDSGDPRAAAIGESAAARLGAAGRRAFARDDIHATRNLLGRAVALLPEGPLRRAFLGDLAHAAIDVGDRAAAVEHLTELERGDAADRATATALRTIMAPPTIWGSGFDAALEEIRQARETLAAAGDALGVARCEDARAWLCWGKVYKSSLTAWLNALNTLRDAGILTRQRSIISWVVNAAFHFGLTADEIRVSLDELEERAADLGPLLTATLRGARARIDYTAGSIDVDQLREATREEVALAEESGIPVSRSITAYYLETSVPWLEQDSEERELGRRRMVEIEETLGTNLYLANTLGGWAIALTETGDPDAALEAVARGREVMEPGDVADEIVLDVAEAYARAALGATESALELIERARATIAPTDSATERNDVDYIDARIRALSGDVGAARALLEALVERSEARGFHRYADRYRADLAALG
jgi:class 3 adenylate cyclase/tetratricopeptide (TPR) repeat protein